MRRTFVPILLVAFAASAGGQPEADKLPKDARKLIDAADAEVDKARKKFEAEAQAIRTKLVADLQKQLDAETKKGNLDGALAVRGAIEKVKEAGPETATDDKSVKDAKKVLVGGKWRVSVLGTFYKAEWEFRDDGTLTRNESGAPEGKWSVETRGRAKFLRIVWTEGIHEEFPFPLNAKKMLGTKFPSKERLELVRLSDK